MPRAQPLAVAFGAGAVLAAAAFGVAGVFFTAGVLGFVAAGFALVAACFGAGFLVAGFLAVADFAGVFLAGFAFWAS